MKYRIAKTCMSGASKVDGAFPMKRIQALRMSHDLILDHTFVHLTRGDLRNTWKSRDSARIASRP
jgi:hypothetical protein